jgi:hypothetical protein
VALVDREDSPRPKAVRQDDDSKVSEARPKGRIAGAEVEDRGIFCRLEAFHLESARSDVLNEEPGGALAGSLGQKVVNLS